MKTEFQSAQDNWPEDEALLVAKSYAEMLDYEDIEYCDAELAKDCVRFRKIFMIEPDGEELFDRFIKEVTRLKSEMFKLLETSQIAPQ